MKVSKVVLIVVALHVLVIGGIFIFEGCSRSQAPTPDMAANESLPGQIPDALASLPEGLTPAMPMAPEPTAAVAPQPATRTYLVKKGDSLWKIAQMEKITVGELAQANKLGKNSTLQIGQVLQIPQQVRAETVTTMASTTIPGQSDVTTIATAETSGEAYTVKAGDSLWKIAQQHRTSVASIKQANNLSSDMLKIGQKLRIPTTTTVAASATVPVVSAGIAPTTYADFRDPGTYMENGQTIHYVDAGESLAVIAKKYGVKTEDVIRANNITDARRLNYGQRLIIPRAPTIQ